MVALDATTGTEIWTAGDDAASYTPAFPLERDGQALDLLLATDLSPKEFVFGKLLGVFWVTKEMVVLPMALCVMLFWRGQINGESLAMLLMGLAVMYVFVNMLGVHCGMHYANSRIWKIRLRYPV